MALINCPNCGKTISDKAAKCPHCGKVMKLEKPQVEEPAADPQPQPQFSSAQTQASAPQKGSPNMDGAKLGDIPNERLKQFNWASLSIGPLWCIISGLPVHGLIYLILYGIFMVGHENNLSGKNYFIGLLLWILWCIFMGRHGNTLAWENRRWRSAEHFWKVQEEWSRIGKIVFIVECAICAIAFILLVAGGVFTASQYSY